MGYYQLIHLEGSPLTRIDGRMIIGMFGGCPPPRCGRITSNCACHAAGSALRRPWRAASSPGSAHGWRWAATGGLLHRHSAVLLHARLFAIATAIGSWFGARFTLLPFFASR
nr:putative inner membrane protein [Klebsiella pneumoniae]